MESRIRFMLALVFCAAVSGLLSPASRALAATSATLPDGRAYEMVTPVEKGGNDVEPRNPFFLQAPGVAGADEAGVAFSTMNGLPGSDSGAILIGNVARRGSAGWEERLLSPPDLNQTGVLTAEPIMVSGDLGQALVDSTVKLTPEAPAGDNLYVRDVGTSDYRLVTPYPARKVSPEGPFEYGAAEGAVGASDDFSRVFFNTRYALTPDTPTSETMKLYEWSPVTGLRNVGILPGQTEATSRSITTYRPVLRPVSEDGSQVVFGAEDGGGVGQVFLRQDGARTIQVSALAPGASDPDGPKPATFVGAAADGSSIFFTSASRLTEDAATGESPGGATDLAPNLYRYDVASGALEDLTVDRAGDELGADVGTTIVAPDGNAAYFVATGELAAGGSAGQPNLYRWDLGEGISFVASLAPGDPLLFEASAAATDFSGNALAFVSTAGLAGETAASGIPEIYHYSAAEGLACASCGSGSIEAGATLVAPLLQLGSGAGHPLSADGRKVFFSTRDALVPTDTNGREDVYEWEAGQDYLISSGTSRYDSFLVDASPSGKDVFFATREQLVPADRDENTDIYDAREGGGFPVAAPEPPPCEAEACRGPVSAPGTPPSIGSRSFSGPGNKRAAVTRHRRAKKQKGCRAKAKKCVKKHRRKPAGKRG